MIYLLILFQVNLSPVARIHYSGGGDWYGNKTTFKNIFRYYEHTFKTKMPLNEETVKLSETKLFSYPILYISGHGNVSFDDQEVNNLRQYLTTGGFLYVDDDFGIDKAIRRELKKVLPNSEFVELPFGHEIFKYPFSFPKGLPKIHEHAGGAPVAYGLFYEDRMVVLYTFNTDISDGCEDPEIHEDSDELRLQALKMATNILSFALNH